MSTEHSDEITEVNEDLELNSEDAENVAGGRGILLNKAEPGEGDSQIFIL